MKTATKLAGTVLAMACMLAGCGGSQVDANQGAASKRAAIKRAAIDLTTSAAFSGARANYTITSTATGFTVADLAGSEGTRTFTAGTTRLFFTDSAVAMDIAGNAGQAYRLYQAAFNRTPDLPGLGWQILAIDSGATLKQISENFLNSAEFKALYGDNPTNGQLVTLLYNNVLHRAPEQAGYDHWMNVLNTNQLTRAEVLYYFSESAENQAQVLGAIQNGIGYTPYFGEPNFTTLAGTAGSLNKSADGTGSAAQFYAPRGVTVDAAGTLYVADSSNNTIRKITADGTTTTLAGSPDGRGKVDGVGAAARFTEPFGVAADKNGNLFVADTSSNAIRKIGADGTVTTFAGSGAPGALDGTGAAASFNEPRGVAVDANGNVYVADYFNHIIRKITAAGVVTTVAGSAGVQGSADGSGTAARFRGPNGIAVDSAGNLYVTDTGNKTIRKITPAGVVTTFAGSPNAGGTLDATGTAARFSEPRGIAIDSAGNLYVADYSAHVIRKITTAGVVTTIAGKANTPGTGDATGTSAGFYNPSGVAADANGNLYVADTSNNIIRKIGASGAVTTLAGLAGRSSSVDGAGSAARFEDPYATAVDSAGNVYVADATDHSIRKITPAGVVTTLAGSPGSFGSSDGSGSAARFKNPEGIAVDTGGNVYVADTGNNTIRKITPAGVVTTLAGSAGQGGFNDGSGTAARFGGPMGIAVDTGGNLYVADTSNNTIRKITAAGVVTTLAGTAGQNGLVNGTGSAARFMVPFDVAADGWGNVYVCDHGNHVIRKITSAGVVTTLAGSGSPGNSDGDASAASFRFPSGVAVDSLGYVYVADTDNQVIRKIGGTGVVSTIAGGTGKIGSTDGTGIAARFFNPKDVAVDANGSLYIADRGNHTVRKGS